MPIRSRQYDRDVFTATNAAFGYSLQLQESQLDAQTAVLAHGCAVVCPFVNDILDEATLETLHEDGTQLVTLCSAGFNHVDLAAAVQLRIGVVRVPAYSPHAVAEYTAGLILTLNRKLHRAYARTRDGDFSLNGLLGFDLHGKTLRIIGTGVIGRVFRRIMAGFGMKLLAFIRARQQPIFSSTIGGALCAAGYAAESDIVSLHCPLLPSTYHLIDDAALARMKHGQC